MRITKDEFQKIVDEMKKKEVMIDMWTEQRIYYDCYMESEHGDAGDRD